MSVYTSDQEIGLHVLGVRARKALARGGIITVDGARAISDAELYSIRECGATTVAEIRKHFPFQEGASRRIDLRPCLLEMATQFRKAAESLESAARKMVC